jgi:apolipoprotein N-acyltransferase
VTTARSDSVHAAWPLALAVLGGLCLAAAAPPLRLWPAAFLALALLAAALDLAAARSVRLAAVVGLVFGTAVHAAGLYALLEVFERFGRQPAWLAVATAAATWLLQALPYGLALLAARWLAPGRAWVALPATLTAATGLVPQLFPWQPGALLVEALPYAQLGELGGAALVTLAAAAAACAGWELVRRRTGARAPLFVLAAALLLPVVHGTLRLGTLRAERTAAPRLRLGVVQPNAGLASVADEPARLALLAQLRAMTRALERRGVDATVWPESAYAFSLSRRRSAQPGEPRRIVGDDVRGPVLFGAITYEGEQGRSYNSALLVASDGRLGPRVDKVELLPFAEYLPLWHASSWLQRRYASPGLAAGAAGRIAVRGAPLGVLICYEDLFTRLGREQARDGARALVNLTNDGWFGASHEPALHDLVARMRSIETRRELLRVTNTGVSSHSAASGELLAQTRPNVAASFVAELALHDALTPYVRLGDWVPLGCLVYGLKLWAYSARARRRFSGTNS